MASFLLNIKTTEDRPHERQQRQRRRRESQRLRRDLIRALVASLVLHWGGFMLGRADLFPRQPPPELIPFQLISLPEDVQELPQDPDATSVNTTRAEGSSDPELSEISAGGAAQRSSAPPALEEQLPPSAPIRAAEAGVSSVPVASLQRRSEQVVVEPTPATLSQTLRQELEEAVQSQHWQAAIEAVDQMALALPEGAGQLSHYRDRLQHLLSEAETPDPTPTPQSSPVPSPSPIPSQTPAEPASPSYLDAVSQFDPSTAHPPQPNLAAPSVPTVQPRPTPIAANLAQGSGSGGQSSGIANSQRPSDETTQISTIADPLWAEYLDRLQAKVQENWSVRKAEDSYSTVVVFTVSKQGQLQTMRVQNPSQDPLVDAAVMSAIRQAAPFDPLPDSFAGEQFTFELDVLSGAQQTVMRSP